MVHVPVAGFHTSAECAGDVSLLKPAPLLPPVTSTRPSGRMVRLFCRRAVPMLPVKFHVGVPALRSMISHVAVGGSPPPAQRILPTSCVPRNRSCRDHQSVCCRRWSTSRRPPCPDSAKSMWQRTRGHWALETCADKGQAELRAREVAPRTAAHLPDLRQRVVRVVRIVTAGRNQHVAIGQRRA